MRSKAIYVEIPIKTKMEDLWETTQTPHLHEQWDLRFSSITYLPKEKESDPQSFLYKTNIGFGLAIEGWGKSVGSIEAEDGSRTSSLHFGTDQPISLIQEGRGYWKYQPEQDSITFLTRYTYDVNFGMLGKVVDYFFRPIMGWATALSFDVLKRWLEKGESPFSQYIRFFSHWLIVYLFVLIWTYHGLIPKLMYMHPNEISMVTNLVPLSFEQGRTVVLIAGIAEIIFAQAWVWYRNKRRLFGLQIILFPFLTLSAILADFAYLVNPFNPLTFNISLFILSVIGFLISNDIPTAKSCKRKQSGD
ncbi:DoxX-like protein [Bacillus oleivorans]|uniref:DoxX-like protein n=1 Tax=Bacillus oleivorans TaxID=1448271 RepID=A0A285D5C8_9BACI|nr:DoxX-like family protein [Bacillus oleivorans]SNX74488.1 DoxX-like protein [Bacillus oleivorans]